MSRETPFQGSCGVCGNEPRALPWAGMTDAFGVVCQANAAWKLREHPG
jgi:hypothetical protein